jgi:manganese transport protein
MKVCPGKPGLAVEQLPKEIKGTRVAARAALEGRARGLSAILPFLGPAFVASVAYVDPGNFATNIQGGSAFGYNLLWVVVVANLMAMLLQTLSAKLGLATGKNLAELSRKHFPRPIVYLMWVVSEVGAMATDLAEFIYLILLLERRGFRPLEIVITALVAVIALCYVLETLFSRPDWAAVGLHMVTPWEGNSASVLLSVGIIGATVMPHVIYLHSSLMQQRIIPTGEQEARRIFRRTIPDVVLAMGLAGVVNVAMLYMAAATFHAHGQSGIADISAAYRTLMPLLGTAAGIVFGVSLLASGLSSSTVGTMAGQVIMQGFVGFTIPVWIRRLLTMLPAIVVVALGWNPTQTLVISQVVLSFVLPVPVIALVIFTRRRDIMGVLVNHSITTVLAILCAAVILLLNVVLLYQNFGGTLPFLS